MSSKTSKPTTFYSLPLCEETQNGLAEAGYKHPTEIQKESLESALNGDDVLAASKTGSGKTLAFVIPMLELLAKEKWTKIDGLGALIITPTRELAYQIYEVIRKVGKYHDFSIALVLGGKDLKFEWDRLHGINILIATPGRLLHHMDNNANFSADNLKVLILDEADRILDMGFQKELNSIIEHLPKERQTLLFSATQTKSVKQLARLNLKDPIYISIDEESASNTPDSLVQSYIVCDLHDKINILWSFLKSHLHYKIIVFFSTCKQTNYIYELFSQMKINTTFLALYGTLHQLRRMDIYDEFCRRKNAILFCTDIASRGLDFPDINWVIQFDCPEDTNAYIHRVGRTARYKKGGESLLFLMPSEEEAMLEQLKQRNIPINQIQINPTKIRSIQERAAALCARELDLKQRAQRCFKTYLKSVYFMKNKQIFNVKLLDFAAYASSLGLEVSPRLRFFEKDKEIREKMKQTRLKASTETLGEEIDALDDNQPSDQLEKSSSKSAKSKSKAKEKREKNNEQPAKPDEESDDDDFMTLKRKVPCNEELNQGKSTSKQFEFVPRKKLKPVTKQSLAKKLIKRGLAVNKVKKFTDDDQEESEEEFETEFNVEIAKKKLAKADEKDKKTYKEMMRRKMLESKAKLKKQSEDDKTEEEMKQTDELIDELPDPETVYNEGDGLDNEADGNENSEDNENSDFNENSDSNENDVNESSDEESD